MTNEELNLSELVETCVHEFINRYPNKPVTLNIQPDVFVRGDGLLLQMAVNNLVDNAIKFSPKSSPLYLKLMQHEDILLTVTDEGSGIRDEDKKKVFEKFYRAGNTATKLPKAQA